MEVVHERCAGIDIAKKGAVVNIRVQGRGRRRTENVVSQWGSMTRDILQLRAHLEEQQVSRVVMEATGDFWKPFFYLLEDADFETMLVNAKAARNHPGRKSDVSDAAWLAQLGAFGLVRASFVPPAPIRQLRDLTRTRTLITQQRTREIQRLENVLEDAGIKLSVVASDVMGVSSRKMLESMIAGQRDAAVLADLAYGKMRAKVPELTQALTGRFTEHHGFLLKVHLELIDKHTAMIEELTARIEQQVRPFRPFRELICSIPGVSTTVADVVIAETGADMTRFPSAAHLASWAGVAPGSNQSAEVVKPARCLDGNTHLKGALGTVALQAAKHTNKTYLGARYRRVVTHRGKKRALVAVEHKVLTMIWTMATTGELYREAGPDYYLRRRPQQARNRAIKQLQTLGYRVTLEPAN